MTGEPIVAPYTVLVLPGQGIYLARTDGLQTAPVIHGADVDLLTRIAVLLNRHGLEDQPLPNPEGAPRHEPQEQEERQHEEHLAAEPARDVAWRADGNGNGDARPGR